MADDGVAGPGAAVQRLGDAVDRIHLVVNVRAEVAQESLGLRRARQEPRAVNAADQQPDVPPGPVLGLRESDRAQSAAVPDLDTVEDVDD
ncbi:hypothetical protein GCM10009530_06820 [Microbispora corallina]|uniref:Uncharacterized protein n=1 Tax=Microbispora corallina TaxID=83302 RepID=A0ABQ4FUZ3_9ACTN|nr:hypothetical protein Mco01_16450 [Microbispora corallina]